MQLADHIKSQVSNSLGIANPGNGVRGSERDLWQASEKWMLRYADCLTAKDHHDAELKPKAPIIAEDFHSKLEEHEQCLLLSAGRQGLPLVSLCRWPGGAPFALFLSHDIDQIYDRELFRVLADVNHIRRILTQGETGNAPSAARRLLRALFRPKRTLVDFETILQIERRHGFRSTFFLLHDRYWARQGARFSFEDREIQEIGRMALHAGCELGVHGGYYRFNRPDLYRESKEAVATVFGHEPVGVRNHLLRFSYPETWRAQAEAGFEYDATYGFRSVPGARAGLALPFFPFDESAEKPLPLLELPLAVMDTSIFRYLRLEGEAALDFAWQLVARLANHGALVSLLWHNNFFNEPEYWDWQMVYEKLLERLAVLKPWCATGAEINRWWRQRAGVSVTTEQQSGLMIWRLKTAEAIEGLAVRVRSANRLPRLNIVGASATVEESPGEIRVVFPRLSPSTECILRAELALPG